MSFPELADLPSEGVLLKSNLLIDAAKTEDEVGMVLRLHLILEQFLNAFLAWKIDDEMKQVVKPPRDFGQKLGLAVAFGLNRDLSKTIYQFNHVRNKLAHGIHQALERDWISEYLRSAEKLSADHSPYGQLEHAKVDLIANETSTYGTGNNRADIFLAWIFCWQAIIASMKSTRKGAT